MNVDRYGNTSSGSIPLALADARRRTAEARGRLVLMTGMGAGLTWGSALIEWTNGDDRRDMSKIAFCFPGPGLARAGHGPRHRRGRARGDGGLRARQRGVRASTCASSASRRRSSELVDTEVQQPALVATSLAIARGAPRARASSPDYVVGHSVGEFAALAAAESRSSVEEAIALVRERGLAMAEAAREHPGSMAAILGLDDEVVETLCRQDPRRLARELQLPGPDRRLGRERRRRRVLRARPSARARAATVKLQVSGAFHCPLVARAAERLRPAIERVRLQRAAARRSCRRSPPGSSRRSASARSSSTS